MWATLAEHARLFAVDLPGFGASERRDELLSPRAMGRFLAPDVGTSAALLAAAAHPERIASVIVGTGGAAVPIQLGEPLRSWSSTTTSTSTARWTHARSSARRSTRSRAA
jgi:pimeloyl-ACP methyl ester carboxylesterase